MASTSPEAEQQTTATDSDPLPPVLQDHLTRNLTALRHARPDIFSIVSDADFSGDDRYTIDTSGPAPTLLRKEPDGSLTNMHLGGAAARSFTQRESALAPYRQALTAKAGKAICGIGDGTILNWLSRHAPPANTTGDGTVYLLERDLQLLVYVMMLHDWSSPTGPIISSRFHWFVGPDYQALAEQTLLADPMLVESGCVIGQGESAAELTGFWKQLTAKRHQAHETDRQLAHAHSASCTADTLAALLSPSPPRPPRILLMTSHHTTVLQYSTRDAAAAFEQLGWQTQILVEQQPDHVMCEAAVMRAIATFKPDVLFSIDHLRSEIPNLPRELPHICWIQDDLPHLTTSAAGRAVQHRDFIIGSWLNSYMRDFAYPASQCIAMRRLTQPIQNRNAITNATTGVDLLYVSNHAQPPQQRLESILTSAQQAGRIDTKTSQLLRTIGEVMIEHYAADSWFWFRSRIKSFIQSTCVEMDIPEPDAATLDTMSRLLEELHNTLYRQQALRWIAREARKRQLTLGLYGHGWEAHPDFASFARGPIEYGRPLQQLTRASTINLQLEPFAPTHHQRLLDGLAAGGFFLCRKLRPHETELRNWLTFVQQLDQSIETVADAHASLDEPTCTEMDACLAALTAKYPSWTDADPIAAVRSPRMQRQIRLLYSAPLPPRYDDVAFFDADELSCKLDQFLDDAPARQAIVDVQREFVEAGFSYTSGLRSVVHEIGKRIAAQATQHHQQQPVIRNNAP